MNKKSCKNTNSTADISTVEFFVLFCHIIESMKDSADLIAFFAIFL